MNHESNYGRSIGGRRNAEGRRHISQYQKPMHIVRNRSDWRRKTEKSWAANRPKTLMKKYLQNEILRI